MKNKVVYWNGVFGNKEDLLSHQGAINKLLEGDYYGADLDLKKLPGHKVYSVRINASDRLLFTPITFHNRPSLLLLEVILNHDYQKSKFLKPGVLKNFLEAHADRLTQEEEAVGQYYFMAVDKEAQHALPHDALPQSEHAAPEFVPVNFYNKKFIELNGQQQCVLQASLPLAVSGGAGSGKSCMALLLLAEFAVRLEGANYPDDEDKKILLYVTKSQKLAEGLEAMWKESPISYETNHEVQFLTYEQMLLDRDPDCREKKFVSEKEFKMWITSYIKDYKNQLKAKQHAPLSDHLLVSTEDIYQEFRIISGYDTDKDYLTLGEKQSLFYQQEERTWLLAAYKKYQEYLRNQQMLDASFYVMNEKNRYSLIVVDESQDLSRLQIKNLHQLAKDSQICYCMDSHQSLFDDLSIRPYLLTIPHISHIDLPFSYRCKTNILKLANSVIQLKNVLTGGRADKKEYDEIVLSTEPGLALGEVDWLEKMSEEEVASFTHAAETSVQFAIVTWNEYKQEVKDRFGNPALVFTPEEIKGLEYTHIMAYRLFDLDIFKQANKQLAGKAPEEMDKKHFNLAKKGLDKGSWGPPFNKVFTAFTRSIDKLVIYQPQEHALKHLKNFLQKSDVMQESDHISLNITLSTKEEWIEEVKKQEDQGNIEQANAIKENMHLNTGSEAFAHMEMEQEKKLSKKQKKKQNKLSKVDEIQKQKQPARQPETPSFDKNFPKKVLENFNKENLEKLFNDHHFEKYMFQTMVSNDLCLFVKIIKDSRLRAGFTGFLLANKKFIPKLSASELYQVFSVRLGANKNTSPFYFLCQFFYDDLLLGKLFENNPELIKKISVKILCLALTSEAGLWGNTSPLYFLCTTPDGRKLLTELFENNLGLMKKIPAEALCLTLTSQSRVYANTSPLYWLCETPDGRQLLAKLFENNPKLMKEISAQALCLPRTNQAGSNENISAFYFLCTTLDGRQLLTKLFESNPKLMKEISAEALCLPLTSVAGKIKNISPLYWLCGTSDGRQLLAKMFENNLKLMKEISSQALCLPLTSQAGTNGNISPLYWLCGALDGRQLLVKLFENNPALMKNISAKALCLSLTSVSGKDVGTSPLYFLYINPDGGQLLDKLFEENPLLKSSLKEELKNKERNTKFSLYLEEKLNGPQKQSQLITQQFFSEKKADQTKSDYFASEPDDISTRRTR